MIKFQFANENDIVWEDLTEEQFRIKIQHELQRRISTIHTCEPREPPSEILMTDVTAPSVSLK